MNFFADLHAMAQTRHGNIDGRTQNGAEHVTDDGSCRRSTITCPRIDQSRSVRPKLKGHRRRRTDAAGGHEVARSSVIAGGTWPGEGSHAQAALQHSSHSDSQVQRSNHHNNHQQRASNHPPAHHNEVKIRNGNSDSAVERKNLERASGRQQGPPCIEQPTANREETRQGNDQGSDVTRVFSTSPPPMNSTQGGVGFYVEMSRPNEHRGQPPRRNPPKFSSAQKSSKTNKCDHLKRECRDMAEERLRLRHFVRNIQAKSQEKIEYQRKECNLGWRIDVQDKVNELQQAKLKQYQEYAASQQAAAICVLPDAHPDMYKARQHRGGKQQLERRNIIEQQRMNQKKLVAQLMDDLNRVVNQ